MGLHDIINASIYDTMTFAVTMVAKSPRNDWMKHCRKAFHLCVCRGVVRRKQTVNVTKECF